MSHTTEQLAEFVLAADSHRLASTVSEAAKDALIDLLASAAAGWAAPATRCTRRTASELFAAGPSRIWLSDCRRQPAAAALANSAAASALDLDDGHRGAGGHPGAAIWPSVLAVGQALGADGRSIIAAAALGYEVAVRIAAARDFSRLDTLSTGRWSAFGAAAVAGRLQGVSRQVLTQAMAIAGVLSPGLSAAGYSSIMGNQVKEGIPWSVLTGLTALDMAASGMTGPIDILDHPDYFDARAITMGIGDDWALSNVYFKPYACCRWIHAALDGLLALMTDAGIDAKSIRRIAVHTFERALRLNNYPDPPTIEAAQYSIPFCLALGASSGKEALLPLHPACLSDPEVVALARKVRLHVDPDMDRRFPAEAGARVVIETTSGQLERAVRFPLGDPANPLGRPQLVKKFQRLANGVVDVAGQDQLIAAVTTLENQTAETFDVLLGQPKPAPHKIEEEHTT